MRARLRAEASTPPSRDRSATSAAAGRDGRRPHAPFRPSSRATHRPTASFEERPGGSGELGSPLDQRLQCRSDVGPSTLRGCLPRIGFESPPPQPAKCDDCEEDDEHASSPVKPRGRATRVRRGAAARRSAGRSSPGRPGRPRAPRRSRRARARRSRSGAAARAGAPGRRPSSWSNIDSRAVGVPALPVEGDRESMRLVTDPLQQLQARRVVGRARPGRSGRAGRPPRPAWPARSPRRAAGRSACIASSAAASWPLPPSITTRFGVAANDSS